MRNKMSATGLKERLIDRIKEIDDEDILAEAYRLLGTDPDLEEPYQLNSEQKTVIDEARTQIKNGNYLTHNQANKEIDEWLNK
ncbi:hypothetical protein [Dyadobacter fermentans]|uniref:hypothetical protein n=1 Tax=Dyadobacter fermentans TaxID=94254 RepID=UPI001CBB0C2F|nr:hypothetical protein [Dyadobacter fermentans]MBZ1361841.1 hypothetical protein [Dyadobacter fermentans]